MAEASIKLVTKHIVQVDKQLLFLSQSNQDMTFQTLGLKQRLIQLSNILKHTVECIMQVQGTRQEYTRQKQSEKSQYRYLKSAKELKKKMHGAQLRKETLGRISLNLMGKENAIRAEFNRLNKLDQQINIKERYLSRLEAKMEIRESKDKNLDQIAKKQIENGFINQRENLKKKVQFYRGEVMHMKKKDEQNKITIQELQQKLQQAEKIFKEKIYESEIYLNSIEKQSGEYIDELKEELKKKKLQAKQGEATRNETAKKDQQINKLKVELQEKDKKLKQLKAEQGEATRNETAKKDQEINKLKVELQEKDKKLKQLKAEQGEATRNETAKKDQEINKLKVELQEKDKKLKQLKAEQGEATRNETAKKDQEINKLKVELQEKDKKLKQLKAEQGEATRNETAKKDQQINKLKVELQEKDKKLKQLKAEQGEATRNETAKKDQEINKLKVELQEKDKKLKQLKAEQGEATRNEAAKKDQEINKLKVELQEKDKKLKQLKAEQGEATRNETAKKDQEINKLKVELQEKDKKLKQLKAEQGEATRNETAKKDQEINKLKVELQEKDKKLKQLKAEQGEATRNETAKKDQEINKLKVELQEKDKKLKQLKAEQGEATRNEAAKKDQEINKLKVELQEKDKKLKQLKAEQDKWMIEKVKKDKAFFYNQIQLKQKLFLAQQIIEQVDSKSALLKFLWNQISLKDKMLFKLTRQLQYYNQAQDLLKKQFQLISESQSAYHEKLIYQVREQQQKLLDELSLQMNDLRAQIEEKDKILKELKVTVPQKQKIIKTKVIGKSINQKVDESEIQVLKLEIQEKNKIIQNLEELQKILNTKLLQKQRQLEYYFTQIISKNECIKQLLENQLLMSSEQFAQILEKPQNEIRKTQANILQYPSLFSVSGLTNQQIFFILKAFQKLYPLESVFKTNILYSCSNGMQINPHRAVDQKPKYLIIVTASDRNKQRQKIGIYSQQALRKKVTAKINRGFLCSITHKQIMYQENIKAIYNDQCFIYENFEIKLSFEKNTLEINLGEKIGKVEAQNNRSRMNICRYEIYQILLCKKGK